MLEHFDRHRKLPFQAPAGKLSVCKWITAARAKDQELANVPVAFARGAASQARLAWIQKRRIRASQSTDHPRRTGEGRRHPPGRKPPTPTTLEDEEERKKHQPSPRLVRLWSKELKTNKRRGQARRALRLLVPCTPVWERVWNEKLKRHERKTVPGRWHLPGLGQLELLAQDKILADADIRSCHLIERTRHGTPVEKRRYVLKVQLGTPVPEIKEGAHTGVDYGIRNTVTTSEGKVLQRLDTSVLGKRGQSTAGLCQGPVQEALAPVRQAIRGGREAHPEGRTDKRQLGARGSKDPLR